MKVFFILAYVVFTAPQYRCDKYEHGNGICGFQFELLLAHLAEFESRIEGRYETSISKISSFLEGFEANVFNRMKQMEAKLDAIESRIEDRLEITLAQINRAIEANGNTLQSHMEKQFILKADEIEKNVKEGFENTTKRIDKAERIANDHRVFLLNQPAIAREEGWITIQRRFDGSVNFHRTWNEYKNGFGDHREFWLGLENLYQKTMWDQYELLLVLEGFDGEIVYSHYDAFTIGSEDENYEIKLLGNFTGITQDLLRKSEGKPFSTYDKDNTRRNDANCASVRQAGWWFHESDTCMIGHLNGKHSDFNKPPTGWMWQEPTDEEEAGVYWQNIHAQYYLLKSSKMMIRRRLIPRITASADGNSASLGLYERVRSKY